MIKSDIAKKSRKEEFYYGGTMKCGHCGCSITAQNTVNRFGSHYVYYRCTHRKTEITCHQPYLEQKKLEQQIDKVLDTVTMPEKYLNWALEELKRRSQNETTDNTMILKSIHRSIEDCKTKLDELLDVKLKHLITDEEYLDKKNRITAEKADLESRLGQNNQEGETWVKLAEDSFNFIVYAKIRLEHGNIEDKKKILLGLGSNPVLKDKKVQISLQNYLQIVNDGTRAPINEKQMFQPQNFALDKRKNKALGLEFPRWQGW